jgi:hypothetical protein
MLCVNLVGNKMVFWNKQHLKQKAQEDFHCWQQRKDKIRAHIVHAWDTVLSRELEGHGQKIVMERK